jgi:4-amino-4-deoxy-L-arabinose transferase-like glycosyltransferase
MIALAGFLLAHAAYLLLLALAAAWIGRGFVPRLRFDSWMEEAAVALGLGLGVLAHLVLLLGLLGRLSRGPLLAGIALLLAAAAPGSLRRLRETAPRVVRPSRTAIAAGVLVLLVALPLLALPLYPPTDWDATAYHLAQARIFVEEQRVVPTPYLRFAVFPQLNEMLFTLGLALLDEAAAQQAELVVLAALLLAVAAWGRRYLAPRAGLWAAALVLGHPLVAWLGTTAYVDLGLTLFTTLAAACLWNWSAERRRSWLVLAGVFLGFALGTKYIGLLAAGLLGLAALGAAARRRDRRTWAAWLAPCLLAGVAAVVAAPWYLRNAWTTGNPLFPFYPELFGASSWWSALDVQSALASLREGYGIGRTPGALLRLPWALIATPEKFTEVVGLGIIPLALVPVAAAVAVRDRRLRGFLALGFGYFLLWFWNAQVLRFLMPAVPPFALAAAGALDRLASWAGDRWAGLARPGSGRWAPLERGSRWRWAAAAGLALLIAWPSWRGAVGRVRARGALPVTAAARDAYLALHLPTYPAYRLLNQRHGRRYTIYALHDANMAYFAHGTFQGDWFGPARYDRLTPHVRDPAALHRELRELGADYLLVPAAQTAALGGGVAPPAFQPVLAGPWGALHALAGAHSGRESSSSTPR